MKTRWFLRLALAKIVLSLWPQDRLGRVFEGGGVGQMAETRLEAFKRRFLESPKFVWNYACIFSYLRGIRSFFWVLWHSFPERVNRAKAMSCDAIVSTSLITVADSSDLDP